MAKSSPAVSSQKHLFFQHETDKKKSSIFLVLILGISKHENGQRLEIFSSSVLLCSTAPPGS